MYSLIMQSHHDTVLLFNFLSAYTISIGVMGSFNPVISVGGGAYAMSLFPSLVCLRSLKNPLECSHDCH